VLRRLHDQLPKHDIVFFADQAHVPHGDRTLEDLNGLLRANVAWLNARGADAIVMACNTSCATASKLGWPPSQAAIVDLIESAAIAVDTAGYKRIGVIATDATVATRAYTEKITARVRDAQVTEIGAPALVPLVEAGKLEGPEPRAAVAAVCAQLPRELDAVILACTHYPLLDAHFAAVLGDHVVRVDPAVEQAERTVALVRARGLREGSGTILCATSGDRERFRQSVTATLGALPELSFES